jgi:serine protease inhibitor ecotin
VVKLISCPFCGAKVKATHVLFGGTVFNCTNSRCGADIEFVPEDVDIDPTKLWNKRTSEVKNDSKKAK